MTDIDSEIKALRDMLMSSQNITAFTGAGISTESGIPDYRGPNGGWTKITPIEFSEFMNSEDKRRESWRQKLSGGYRMADALPNAGHEGCAALYRMGRLQSVITQNVDGLHQKAGVLDDKVIELHGNSNYATCLSCGKHYELAEVREIFFPDETVPYCHCGGPIKTATISFGQSLSSDVLHAAETATRNCDLMLVMGSSLVVYPAALLPQMAKRMGARLVIINNQETDLDPLCDLVLRRQIGPTLSAALD